MNLSMIFELLLFVVVMVLLSRLPRARCYLDRPNLRLALVLDRNFALIMVVDCWRAQTLHRLPNPTVAQLLLLDNVELTRVR